MRTIMNISIKIIFEKNGSNGFFKSLDKAVDGIKKGYSSGVDGDLNEDYSFSLSETKEKPPEHLEQLSIFGSIEPSKKKTKSHVEKNN